MKEELKEKMIGVIGNPDRLWSQLIAEKCAQIAVDNYKEREKELDTSNVSNQRELLCAFFKYFRDNGEKNIGMTIEQFVDGFLSTQ